MDSLSNFGASMLATSLELTGLEPVLWGMTLLIGACVSVLGYDALQASAWTEASATHRATTRNDPREAVVAFEQAA